jgi:8-oxo-dGTP diphosphatase
VTGRPDDGPGDGDPVEVRAAGGIVVRAGRGDGVGEPATQLAVIHRPRYDDWTFPKGKCDPGESFEDTARREVVEETGLDCRLGPEIGSTRYVDSKGRAKIVRYWLMPAPADADAAVARAVPNPEVDELRWIGPAEAAILLSYTHDRELLARLSGAGWDAVRAGPGPEGSDG